MSWTPVNPSPGAGPSNAKEVTQKSRRKTRSSKPEAITITPENMLEMRAKYGAADLLNRTMAQYTTKESGGEAARQTLELFIEASEMSDEGNARIWDDFIEKEGLWDAFAGKKEFMKAVNYEGRIAPARERYRMTDIRKANARKTLKQYWGDNWEDEFDPQEYRLRQFSEHFLQGLAAVAKSGWPMPMVWKALDAGYRLRILDRSSGSQKAQVFMHRDLTWAKQWLKEAEEGKETKEEVLEDDLISVGPEAVRPKALEGKWKGKETVTVVEEQKATEKMVGKRKREGRGKRERKKKVVATEKGNRIAIGGETEEEQTDMLETGGETTIETATETEGKMIIETAGETTGEVGTVTVIETVIETVGETVGETGIETGEIETGEETESRENTRSEINQPGVFRWKPEDWFPPTFDRADIFQRYSSAQSWRDLLAKGDCVIPAFRWLTDDMEIMSEVSDEFDLYSHHFCRDTTGLLHTSYHSILQQALRQDPIYYALCVAASSDSNLRQISLPGCARYNVAGDYTYLCNRNLNTGIDSIQTSVSLDQEVREGCTEVLEVGQGDPFSAEETSLKETIVICAPGDLHISLPHLTLRSTTGPERRAILQRRTVSDSLIAMGKEETLEAGTAAAEAHRSLTGIAKSPVPGFSPTPEVRGIWGIGDALLGLADWESARVRKEMETLFGESEQEAWNMVRRVLERLAEAMREGYEVQEWAERRDFRRNSFLTYGIEVIGNALCVSPGRERLRFCEMDICGRGTRIATGRMNEISDGVRQRTDHTCR